MALNRASEIVLDCGNIGPLWPSIICQDHLSHEEYMIIASDLHFWHWSRSTWCPGLISSWLHNGPIRALSWHITMVTSYCCLGNWLDTHDHSYCTQESPYNLSGLLTALSQPVLEKISINHHGWHHVTIVSSNIIMHLTYLCVTWYIFMYHMWPFVSQYIFTFLLFSENHWKAQPSYPNPKVKWIETMKLIWWIFL